MKQDCHQLNDRYTELVGDPRQIPGLPQPPQQPNPRQIMKAAYKMMVEMYPSRAYRSNVFESRAKSKANKETGGLAPKRARQRRDDIPHAPTSTDQRKKKSSRPELMEVSTDDSSGDEDHPPRSKKSKKKPPTPPPAQIPVHVTPPRKTREENVDKTRGGKHEKRREEQPAKAPVGELDKSKRREEQRAKSPAGERSKSREDKRQHVKKLTPGDQRGQPIPPGKDKFGKAIATPEVDRSRKSRPITPMASPERVSDFKSPSPPRAATKPRAPAADQGSSTALLTRESSESATPGTSKEARMTVEGVSKDDEKRLDMYGRRQSKHMNFDRNPERDHIELSRETNSAMGKLIAT